MRTDADLLLAADTNMIAVWRLIADADPAGAVVEDGGLLLMSTGVPVGPFNAAFLTEEPKDPDGAVRRIAGHFAGIDWPFNVYFRDQRAPGLSEACSAHGLVEPGPLPLMALTDIPAVGEGEDLSSDDVRTRRITRLDLAAYQSVACRGFDMPQSIAELVANEALLAVPGFVAVVAAIGDEPVGTGAVCITGDTAGIYNIAVLPEARGRGIGAAVTWAAIREGANAGASRAILQSSKAGKPVYERMGFVTVDHYRRFEPPAA